MKKIILIVALVSNLMFTNCGKKTEDPAPTDNTIAVADANGVIERFTFDSNLSGTRRTNATFTNVSTTNLATVTSANRFGVANRALSVPTGGAVRIAGLPLPTGNAARTIACWVHMEGVTNLRRQFISYGTTEDGKVFGLSYNNAVPGTTLKDQFLNYTWGSGNDATREYTNGNTNACGWVLLVAVYTGGTDNKVKLHLNGTLTEITPLSAINTIGTDLVIGGLLGGTPSSPAPFRIDEVSIYNRALTATEVATLYDDRDKILNCPE